MIGEKKIVLFLQRGHDFECEKWDINEGILNSKIGYMYAVDGVLNIEVE